MKIVYYLPSLYAPGGLERIITFKANYMAEHFDDYEVYIITSEQLGQKPHFDLSPKVKHIDLNVPFDWPFNQSRLMKLLKYPFRFRQFRKRFTQVLMELRPDITISTIRRELKFIHSIPDGSLKIGEFHVTRYSYGLEQQRFPGNLLRKNWERKLINNLRQLDKFIVLTDEEKEFWPELNNVSVIPNPIITPTHQWTDCNAKQVIAAGRYAPQKGFDLLIEAWQLVIRKHPSWTLRIFGEGSLRTAFQQRIDEAEMTNSCILEPTTPHITDKYCESSIFVLSSRFEGFGMVITEAMACGIPPVSFACPCGPRDIIQDGLNGFLVENGNITQLAEKISYLIENDEERKQMGQLARERARYFNMKQISLLWKNLFEEITNKQQNK